MDKNKLFSEKKSQHQLRNEPLITGGLIILLIGLTALGQIGFIASLLLILTIHWFMKSSIDELGLLAPKSWTKTIVIGVILTILILLFFTIINPVLLKLFPNEIKDLSRFNTIKDNEFMLLVAIVSSWVTAGFGEELIWRGYILKNLAILFGNKKTSWVLSLIITSLLFGCIHYYQGVVGMVQTGLVGLLLGIIYIRNGKKNLWLNIIIHGSIDTISMVALYFGVV
ncbi:CPBP family intramembrane glutamic endopeptidase [Aquimarina sp. AU474]|uniref:CPBP family intramembrane glutamic endopeptidase n=1 Tax=Aquimarina sp. AU474 TaxID=2108529 RepID=UPI000D69A67B|nr:CPBP family intramembrane glutamic endopeptidase [Aquimarina sp. AU474]